MKIRTTILCRVSSKEQMTEGYSLQAQEKLLKEYALKHGFDENEIKIFSISESASGKKQRQIFNQMMEYVSKNNIATIICEKVDRLTRNLKDAVDVNDWINGVNSDNSIRQVHFVKENVVLDKDSKSNEKFIWNIKVAVAQYYIDNLSEEVKKGQKEKIAQGWMPSRPPIGYKTIGDKGHKIHVIDDEKAPLVRKIFTSYATGNYSLSTLTQMVYQDGLRNDAGNIIARSRIHRLLSEPFYIGKFYWNGQEYPGNHEPLIDNDTFNKVKDILTRKGTPKYRKHAYLLQGKFHCGECGGTITWEMHKGIVYGHCNGYRECSQKVWYKEKAVEDVLSKELAKLQINNPRLVEWVRKALKEGHRDKIDYHSASLTELHHRQEQLDKRLEKFMKTRLMKR